MDGFRNIIQTIRSDQVITRRLYAVTFAAALFFLVLAV